jgi:hypothetical protein
MVINVVSMGRRPQVAKPQVAKPPVAKPPVTTEQKAAAA